MIDRIDLADDNHAHASSDCRQFRKGDGGISHLLAIQGAVALALGGYRICARKGGTCVGGG